MSDSFVVDASVAVKWFVGEDGSGAAERLLGTARELHAPTFMRFELANALWKNWRSRMIDEDQATSGLASVGRTIGRWHATERLLPQAFAWSLAYDHPIYDFCYLALARSLGVPLVTADGRFLRKLAGTSEAQHVLALEALA